MAYLGHVESMNAIEEFAHSFCNLLNVSHVYEQSSSFPNKIRDAADSGWQHRTPAGHGFYQDAWEILRNAGQYESRSLSHQFSQVGFFEISVKTEASNWELSGCQGFHPGSAWTLPDHMQNGLRALAPHSRKCMNDIGEPLLWQ
jgi:hypothetical protein